MKQSTAVFIIGIVLVIAGGAYVAFMDSNNKNSNPNASEQTNGVHNSANKTEITLFIDSKTQECVAGVMKKDCMLVKSSLNQKDWENFYDEIEGFTYEKGYSYEIVVSKEMIKNPPADASSNKYKLVKIVSKKIVSNKANVKVEDKTWKLVELGGKEIQGTDEDYFITFTSKDSSYRAKAGCNGIGGNYEIVDQFRFKAYKGFSTLMACPDMDTEFNFVKNLELADNLSISDDGKELTLNKARMAPLMKFRLVK